MITASTNSWHRKVYTWWYVQRWGVSPSNSTNLCPYMRTILIYAPLRFLFSNWTQIGFLGIWVHLNRITIPACLIATPFLIGYVSYSLKQMAFGMDAILLFGLIIYTLGYMVKMFFDAVNPHNRNVERLGSAIGDTLERLKVIEFFKLIGSWIKAGHDGICPPIHFD